MSTEYIQVKDYDRFQHYRDRDPPWIKLYVRILEDYHFAKLPDNAKAHLILIWVLASRLENKIPSDAAWIGRQIGATEPVDLALLTHDGWLQSWNPETARGRREEWASRYIPRRVREEVLATGRCAECGGRDHLEVDHIIPVSRGGTSERSNLQALCRKCNRIKRVRMSAQAAEPTLRREPDLRTTEAEAEAEKITTTSAVPISGDSTDGQIMAAIREHLYPPDGRPPEGWEEGREFSIMRQLRKLGKSGSQILAVVEGLGCLLRDERVDWLRGKATLRAVFNSKTGCLDMWQQAEDAYYSMGAKMGVKKKAGPQDVRNDFMRAAEQYRAKAAN